MEGPVMKQLKGREMACDLIFLQVEVFDKVAFGSGPTKQQAKSEAATQMLLQLDGKGKQKGASNLSPVTSVGKTSIRH